MGGAVVPAAGAGGPGAVAMPVAVGPVAGPRLMGAAGGWVRDEPAEGFDVGDQFTLPASAQQLGGRS